MKQQLVTLSAAAEILGLTLGAVRARADRGALGLPVVQLAGAGGRRYVRSTDLAALVRGSGLKRGADVPPDHILAGEEPDHPASTHEERR